MWPPLIWMVAVSVKLRSLAPRPRPRSHRQVNRSPAGLPRTVEGLDLDSHPPAEPSGPTPPRTRALLERGRGHLLLRVEERDRRRGADERAVLGLDVELGPRLGELDRHPHVADVLLQPRRPH